MHISSVASLALLLISQVYIAYTAEFPAAASKIGDSADLSTEVNDNFVPVLDQKIERYLPYEVNDEYEYEEPWDLKDEDKKSLSMLRLGKRYLSMLRLGKREDEDEFDQLDKRQLPMLRLGKRQLPMLRLGKRQLPMLRLGKRQLPMLRLGKRQLPMLRLGKRQLPMLRLGKRQLPMLRLGKRQLPMLRLGKRGDENMDEAFSSV